MSTDVVATRDRAVERESLRLTQDKLLQKVGELEDANLHLQDQIRLSQLMCDVGLALTGSADLTNLLQACADLMVRNLDAALALSPDNADVLAKAGEGYENLGERSLALTYFRKALQKGTTLEDLEANPDLRSLLTDPNAQLVLHKALASTTQAAASASR